MSNSDATKPTPRTDVHTFDFDQDSSECRRPDGSGWYVQADFARQLERELAEAQEAIADLNQRLIDRTCGFLDLIQAQQLEIARVTAAHREVCRQVLSLINGNIRLLSERDAAHAQIVSLRSALQHIERSSGSSETVHCCQAALSAPPPPMVPKQAPDIGSDSIVASCNCLTKTPEVKHHKPGCKYRLISERDAAREIIEQAYVHNQNMHCFVTKGRLNDQLNEQTHLLRKFLKP